MKDTSAKTNPSPVGEVQKEIAAAQSVVDTLSQRIIYIESVVDELREHLALLQDKAAALYARNPQQVLAKPLA